MKRRMTLISASVGLVSLATLCYAENKHCGTKVALPVYGDSPIAQDQCAETRCLKQVWNWLTYRAPIRGSFCRGTMFGATENYPPMYTYFLGQNGCRGDSQPSSIQPEPAPAPYRLPTQRRVQKNGTIPDIRGTAETPTLGMPLPNWEETSRSR